MMSNFTIIGITEIKVLKYSVKNVGKGTLINSRRDNN